LATADVVVVEIAADLVHPAASTTMLSAISHIRRRLPLVCGRVAWGVLRTVSVIVSHHSLTWIVHPMGTVA
jgi:hypothetical protein